MASVLTAALLWDPVSGVVGSGIIIAAGFRAPTKRNSRVVPANDDSQSSQFSQSYAETLLHRSGVIERIVPLPIEATGSSHLPQTAIAFRPAEAGTTNFRFKVAPLDTADSGI